MKKKQLDLIFPGTILYEEFMEPLGISAYKLSKDLKVQQTAIGQIIKGSRRITVDMALRLSRYFENTPQFWLNLQNFYDLELETEKKECLIREITPYRKTRNNIPKYASAISVILHEEWQSEKIIKNTAKSR